jgi:hypothetical protein
MLAEYSCTQSAVQRHMQQMLRSFAMNTSTAEEGMTTGR